MDTQKTIQDLLRRLEMFPSRYPGLEAEMSLVDDTAAMKQMKTDFDESMLDMAIELRTFHFERDSE